MSPLPHLFPSAFKPQGNKDSIALLMLSVPKSCGTSPLMLPLPHKPCKALPRLQPRLQGQLRFKSLRQSSVPPRLPYNKQGAFCVLLCGRRRGIDHSHTHPTIARQGSVFSLQSRRWNEEPTLPLAVPGPPGKELHLQLQCSLWSAVCRALGLCAVPCRDVCACDSNDSSW